MTAADQWRRAPNGTEMARSPSTTALRTWSWRHKLGRWVRPAQVDPSLVGKRRRRGSADERLLRVGAFGPIGPAERQDDRHE